MNLSEKWTFQSHWIVWVFFGPSPILQIRFQSQHWQWCWLKRIWWRNWCWWWNRRRGFENVNWGWSGSKTAVGVVSHTTTCKSSAKSKLKYTIDSNLFFRFGYRWWTCCWSQSVAKSTTTPLGTKPLCLEYVVDRLTPAQTIYFVRDGGPVTTTGGFAAVLGGVVDSGSTSHSTHTLWYQAGKEKDCGE